MSKRSIQCRPRWFCLSGNVRPVRVFLYHSVPIYKDIFCINIASKRQLQYTRYLYLGTGCYHNIQWSYWTTSGLYIPDRAQRNHSTRKRARLSSRPRPIYTSTRKHNAEDIAQSLHTGMHLSIILYHTWYIRTYYSHRNSIARLTGIH